MSIAALIRKALEIFTVVDVDIDVKDPLVVLEELQDGQDNVIDVAKPACFLFLRMMKPTSPVDSDVCRSVVQLYCCIN